MSDYIPRLNANGMMNNPFWYSNNTFYNMVTTPPHLYGLPNCTCYCLGRWLELFDYYGATEYPRTSINNAYEWYTYNDGYERGQTPKLGAIACWKNKTKVEGRPLGYPGHVAIVEELFLGGGYKTSNSNWGLNHDGDYFVTYNVDSNNYFGDNDLVFQGFIYNPYVDKGRIIHSNFIHYINKRKFMKRRGCIWR